MEIEMDYKRKTYYQFEIPYLTLNGAAKSKYT